MNLKWLLSVILSFAIGQNPAQETTLSGFTMTFPQNPTLNPKALYLSNQISVRELNILEA
jgi:hypothetical protein